MQNSFFENLKNLLESKHRDFLEDFALTFESTGSQKLSQIKKLVLEKNRQGLAPLALDFYSQLLSWNANHLAEIIKKISDGALSFSFQELHSYEGEAQKVFEKMLEEIQIILRDK